MRVKSKRIVFGEEKPKTIHQRWCIMDSTTYNNHLKFPLTWPNSFPMQSLSSRLLLCESTLLSSFVTFKEILSFFNQNIFLVLLSLRLISISSQNLKPFFFPPSSQLPKNFMLQPAIKLKESLISVCHKPSPNL